MKRAPLVAAAALGCAALLLSAIPGEAQLPRDPAERARVIAQILEANARQLTVFDRQGNAVGVVGQRDLYNQPVFSPDRTRLAVIKPDLENESNDLWIMDMATGRSTRITQSQSREGANSPAWSPDGRDVAYVALRDGYFGLYRTPSNGEGSEELLYRNSAPMTLTDWSQDGQYLTYFSSDLGGGRLYALPVEAAGERTPIEVFRSESQATGPRLSPDNRFMAFASNLSGRNEIYVVPFDPSAPEAAASAVTPTQISTTGGTGMAFWRRDGTELYYLGADRAIMAVPVGDGPNPEFGTPQVLFSAPPEILPGVGPGTSSVSRDGERFVIAVPRPQLRQIAVFDREGNVVNRVADPGFYNQPNVSPDGSHIVLMRNDPQTGNLDVWTMDLATGDSTAITADTPPDNAPIWSPDGTHVAYVSTRDGLSGIYRKPADGTGEEELLFQYTPGAGMVLTDWSPDGRYLTFFTGVLVMVPLDDGVAALDRQEIDWLREDYDAGQARFSPDNRYVAFLSNEEDFDRGEVYVRPFDPDRPEAPAGPAVRVSTDGAIGMVAWRQDGRELYYMTRE